MTQMKASALMRLYPTTGESPAIDAPEGHYEPGDDGGYDSLPDAVYDRLYGMAVRGRKLFENELERAARLHGDDLARRRDPASVHDALSELAAVTKQLAALQLAQARAGGVTVPVDPQDEAAALRRRLAELEGAPAKDEPEVKPEPKAEAKSGPDPKAGPKPAAKAPARAAAKPADGKPA
jgi:hypothetical protein